MESVLVRIFSSRHVSGRWGEGWHALSPLPPFFLIKILATCLCSSHYLYYTFTCFLCTVVEVLQLSRIKRQSLKREEVTFDVEVVTLCPGVRVQVISFIP